MINYWLIYQGLSTPHGIEKLVKRMATMKGTLGTVFGSFIGMYLIIITMAIINGVSLRFMGQSVMGYMSETVSSIGGE